MKFDDATVARFVLAKGWVTEEQIKEALLPQPRGHARLPRPRTADRKHHGDRAVDRRVRAGPDALPPRDRAASLSGQFVR